VNSFVALEASPNLSPTADYSHPNKARKQFELLLLAAALQEELFL
jgi:hypothetical protein